MRAPMIPRLAFALTFAGFADLGCRSTSPSAPPPAPSSTPIPSASSSVLPLSPTVPPLEAPIAPALLAHASDAGICRAYATDTGLQAAPCVHTPAPVAQLAFLKSGEAVALLDSGSVVRTDGSALVALPPPPQSAWARPKPARSGVAMGPGSARKLVVTGEDEVWLGRCAWVALQDEPTCLSWAFARLAPSPATRDDEPRARRDPAWDAPSTPPSGIKARVEESPESGAPIRVVCTQGGAPSTFTVPGAQGAFTHGSLEWLGAPSRYYRLTVTHDFLETVRGEVLLIKACDATAREAVARVGSQEEAEIVHGPDGLWMHPGDGGWVVRRRERILGRLPGTTATPVLAPSPASAR